MIHLFAAGHLNHVSVQFFKWKRSYVLFHSIDTNIYPNYVLLDDLCEPNPCGANAKCQPGHDNTGKERPVCTCLPGYVGNALTACQRGECQSDGECRGDQNCINYECKPTCIDQCGTDAICNAQNHVATCSCPPGYTGNAIARCYPNSERRGRYYYRYSKK